MNLMQTIAAALTPQGILWTMLLLSTIVALHELGHYALARWQGVKVDAFSVGMGPVLARRQWRGTEWRLSALPLGGYVLIDGMAPDERPGPGGEPEYVTPQHGFAALPALGRIAVLLAGPLVNLLLAAGLMTAMFSLLGAAANDRIRIEAVLPGKPAAALGLQVGDEIVALDGQPIPQTFTRDGREVPGFMQLGQVLEQPGPHTLTVRTAAGVQREVAFDWQPTLNGEKQLLGVRYGPGQQRLSVPAAVARSVDITVGAVPLVVQGFANTVGKMLTLDVSHPAKTGAAAGQEEDGVGGPIFITQTVSEAAAVSGWALVQIAILLNLSLGVFNLLPIPGLDGGRIALVLLEMLRGRPLTFAQEQRLTLLGFAFVMMLSGFVLLRDVTRFF
ncbi:M50 family metallopeptidase [Deinococcus lacus]|uniref:M50 family metallopeptidase n=1 Tax=Deinococcus lacus TaxID=392561 RepID=A0ABW1YAL6_9DEIO